MSVNSAIECYNKTTEEFEPYITDSSIVSSRLKNEINDLKAKISELEEIVSGLSQHSEG